EWKKVTIQDDLDKKIEEAKKQASSYKSGSLASLELANYCYLIIVSQNKLNIKNKEFDYNGNVFRVINIVCFPKTPSGKQIIN
ncbi:MAG: hypothetical protein ACHQJ6_06280, partial [Candidatus Berkiellales bacterium]